MAHFFRLIAFSLCFYSLSAFALVPTASVVQYSQGHYSPYHFVSDGGAACGEVVAYKAAQDSCFAVAMVGVIGNQCTYSRTGQAACNREGQNYTEVSTLLTQTVQACPINSVPSGSACLCSSGFVEDSSGTGCQVYIDPNVAHCAAVAGMAAGSFNAPHVTGTSMGSTFTSLCDPGSAITGGSTCGVTVDYLFAVVDGGLWVKQGKGVFTGLPCVASGESPIPQPSSESPTAAPTINPCRTGEVPGTVNGLSVCAPVADRNVVMAGPVTSASALSGSASAPTSGLGADAPPTAVKSSKQTTCTGGTCTTLQTYLDSGGGLVGAVSTDQSQTGFCSENPKAVICGDGGSFSGTCGAAPACTGDAVLCAVAAATFATNCALSMPDTSDEKSKYDAAKGTTGDQTGSLPGNDSFSFGGGSFDQTNILGGAGGMTDLTITVEGQTVTLPFSTINPWLEKLGSLLQAVTFLICAYIVTGNKQSGAA